VDVRLSAEQQALADAATQVVDRLGPTTVGLLDDAERAAKLDAAVTASGWRELRTPTDDGTPWASGVEVGILAEQLGRGVADTAFIGPTMAAELRRRAGAPVATAAETIVLAAGLGTLAIVTADGTPAGAVAFDTAGAESALLIRPADGGWELVSVAIGSGAPATDLTRSIDAVPAGTAVQSVGGTQDLTDRDLTSWLALGLAASSADLVGTMAGAVELATEYAKERNQYGKAIGSFQAVQHLLADAHTWTEGSRSITRYATWAADSLKPGEAVAAASLAKAYTARAARKACETSIQVHGGIGNTWECRAHVHLRRALLTSEVFGGIDANLTRVLADRGIGDVDGLR
jgi:hypothetical protein